MKINPKIRELIDNRINKHLTSEEMNVEVLKILQRYSPSFDCLIDNFVITSKIIGTRYNNAYYEELQSN